MHEDKERDYAPIAEKERLADILEKKAGNAYYAITSVDLRQAAAILRGDEQPKPDRAEVLAGEVISAANIVSYDGYYELDEEAVTTIIRRHFDELRAEWEAERPAVVVPREVKLWADSVGYCSATRYEERTTAKWIKSLDGATEHIWADKHLIDGAKGDE